jgi:hypothetical protein
MCARKGCLALSIAGLGLAGGCSNDGLTSQQRFELHQQQSKQMHEWVMASEKSHEDMVLQMPQSMSKSTAPYSLKLDAQGRPVLIVDGAPRQEFVLDVKDHVMTPTTRPTP